MVDEQKACAACLYMLVIVICIVSTGCDSGSSNDEGLSAVTPSRVSGWIEKLEQAYLDGGISAFKAGKERMIADETLIRESLANDAASMVLGLRETSITEKEADLAAQLRALARQIEANPGKSHEICARLTDKLFSYCFGNGPIDRESVPMQLAELYCLIANGPGSSEGGERPAQTANSKRPTTKRALAEATDSFTCDGKPIHPAVLHQFMSQGPDGRSLTVSVDLLAAHFYSDCLRFEIRHREDWIESRLSDVRPEFQDYETFGYKRLGVLADGTHVLYTLWSGGGSGAYCRLMFIRFHTETAYDLRAKPYTRIMMKVVGDYSLGDRDDGEITVLRDRVIAGLSKHRGKAIVIKID